MKERKVREAFAIEERKPAMNRNKGVEKSRTWNGLFYLTIHRAVHMTSTCFKTRTVCYHQHDHFFNQLFLALTTVKPRK